MEYRFKLFEPPAEEGDDEDAHRKLKELCDLMVDEAVSREPLACDLDEERWIGRNETIFH